MKVLISLRLSCTIPLEDPTVMTACLNYPNLSDISTNRTDALRMNKMYYAAGFCA